MVLYRSMVVSRRHVTNCFHVDVCTSCGSTVDPPRLIRVLRVGRGRGGGRGGCRGSVGGGKLGASSGGSGHV